MSMTIAVTGKGGVGRTALSSLMVQWLVKHRRSPVLAVDADSNANLHEALGVDYEAAVGGIREYAHDEEQDLDGIARNDFLDLRIQEALVEADGYDLIVMGRPEGPDCYCFASQVLRDVIKKLSAKYKYVIIDSEAGTEHISHRTEMPLDWLIIVSDCTVKGIRTAKKIAEAAKEMHASAVEIGLVINLAADEIVPKAVQDEIDVAGLHLIAVIPTDENVAAMDAGGMPVGGLPADSPSRKAVGKLMEKLLDKPSVAQT